MQEHEYLNMVFTRDDSCKYIDYRFSDPDRILSRLSSADISCKAVLNHQLFSLLLSKNMYLREYVTLLRGIGDSDFLIAHVTDQNLPLIAVYLIEEWPDYRLKLFESIVDPEIKGSFVFQTIFHENSAVPSVPQIDSYLEEHVEILTGKTLTNPFMSSILRKGIKFKTLKSGFPKQLLDFVLANNLFAPSFDNYCTIVNLTTTNNPVLLNKPYSTLYGNSLRQSPYFLSNIKSFIDSTQGASFDESEDTLKRISGDSNVDLEMFRKVAKSFNNLSVKDLSQFDNMKQDCLIDERLFHPNVRNFHIVDKKGKVAAFDEVVLHSDLNSIVFGHDAQSKQMWEHIILDGGLSFNRVKQLLDRNQQFNIRVSEDFNNLDSHVLSLLIELKRIDVSQSDYAVMQKLRPEVNALLIKAFPGVYGTEQYLRQMLSSYPERDKKQLARSLASINPNVQYPLLNEVVLDNRSER